MRVCVCACACARVCVRVCVCVRERERGRGERGLERLEKRVYSGENGWEAAATGGNEHVAVEQSRWRIGRRDAGCCWKKRRRNGARDVNV